MSTKPTQVATWESSGTNESAITSGHATSGYATNDVPAAQEINTVLRLAGAWEQYLSDGSFTDGVMIDDLTVTGDTTLAGVTLGNLTVTGNLTVDGTVYRTSAITRGVGFSPASETNNVTLLPAQLTSTTSAWLWSTRFGEQGDLATHFFLASSSLTVADTVSWTLSVLALNTSTGAQSQTVAASGSLSVSASTQAAFLTALPAESLSYEPLATNQQYLLQLEGTASGTVLRGPVFVTLTRPVAV